MDKEKLIGLARNIFPDISPVAERNDLYRGELKISGKQAGIYYMDLSGEIPVDTFNEYQEKLLADEYYNHPGNLQWNLYLLLLQDTVNPEAKEKIERNDKYARKYVFTESQFEDFFRLEKSDAVVSSNIVLQWKETLKKVDLQEVYSKAKYTEAVERFISNQTKKITSTESASDLTDNTKINFINQITLKNTYREHPKEPRIFRFGKVNLIKGINGVGKTCLLESVELVACGRTYRNSDKKEPDNCIEAIINNSRQTEYCTPTDNTKYRLRDAYWYSNNYAKDNYIYTSFNRFNFFNTDAANELVKSNSEDQVKQALSNIILGTEFNYISERINGFYDRIRPVYNELDRDVQEARQTIKNADQLIARLSKSETLNALLTVITGNIKALQFKNKDLDPEKGTGETEALINQVKALTEKILASRTPSFSNRKELESAKKELSQKEISFNEFKAGLEKIAKDISSQEQSINTITAKANLLTSVQKYFDDPRLFEVKGFNKRLSDVEVSIRRIQSMNRGIGSINVQSFSTEENINTVLDRNRTDLAASKSVLNSLETELKNLLAQFNSTDKIVNEIKLLGKQYLTVSPDADSCPLCQSPFEHLELQKRITEISQNNSKENQEKIDSLHQKQQAAKDTFDKLTQFLNELSAIKTVFENTFSSDSKDMTVADIVQEISRFKEEENSFNQRKQELIAFQQTTESFNITEEEFSYLSNKLLTDIGPEFILSFDNKRLFEDRLSELNSGNDQLKEQLETLQESKFKLSADFKKAIGLGEDKTYTLNEFSTILDNEKRNIAVIENYFDQIIQVIEVRDDEPVSEIDLRLSVLQKNLASLKAEQQNQYELNQAEKNKQQAQAFLDKNDKKFDRIKQGFEALQTLRQSDGTDQLDSFFESNLKEVVDIFKTIHAPREFKSLVFQDKQLFLIKENDKRHRVNEISTGQRAALALSIFISLNRQLKNGPNLMIYDDPVSHIDDLNALSFLDFLRFFILKEDRQIFFATANTRLASLFEKKFEFLESDFQKWELKR
jgi:DNA repair exonuclease SbcCD ATPase subunit